MCAVVAAGLVRGGAWRTWTLEVGRDIGVLDCILYILNTAMHFDIFLATQ